jgi:hypothetical protein
VAAAVRLPEFLAAASGLAQRLSGVGVPTDVLVAGGGDERADAADDVALAELGVSTLRRHRLALPVPFGEDREDDLVAALSELVGFDPEPGLYCLVPVGTDPGQVALRRAARRIARVYRMRVIGYPTAPHAAGMTLTLDAAEWRRKAAALAACSAGVGRPPASPPPASAPPADPSADRLEHFVPA